MTPRLAEWFRETYAERSAAVAAGEARIDWALPEYRVGFSELCAKAEELGIECNVVDLRLWADAMLRNVK